jgi:hypothetical protein
MDKAMKIVDLKAAPFNPRKWADKAGDGLRESLKQFGDIAGIVFNRRTGHLVSGHFRIAQLRKLHGDNLPLTDQGIVLPTGDVWPVRYVDWDEAKEKAANVAANNPHIGGLFDDSLRDLLDSIAVDSPELFAAINLDELLELRASDLFVTDKSQTGQQPPDFQPDASGNKQLDKIGVHKCPKCGHEFSR